MLPLKPIKFQNPIRKWRDTEWKKKMERDFKISAIRMRGCGSWLLPNFEQVHNSL